MKHQKQKQQIVPFKPSPLRFIRRRCRKCFAPIITTCDRSKPSEAVEWLGRQWTVENHQTMMMYPSEKPITTDLCYRHQGQKDAKQGKLVVGKCSGFITIKEADL